MLVKRITIEWICVTLENHTVVKYLFKTNKIDQVCPTEPLCSCAPSLESPPGCVQTVVMAAGLGHCEAL